MSNDWEDLGLTRRGYIARLLASGTAVTGSVGLSLKGYGVDLEDNPPIRVYRPNETYDRDRDVVTYTPDEDDVIESWDEALPGGCSLEADERHWLVSRVDSYDNLEGDDFFDYVGREVRFHRSDSELRMEVDPDYSGEFGAEAEYVVEKGYNIEDAC